MVEIMLFLTACIAPQTPTDAGQPPDPEACLAAAPEDAFPLDPDGPGGQIHVASAFDGDQIWLAWNRPGDNAAFQVWAGAMGCDGAFVVPPFRVEDSPMNQIDPTLAIRGDDVLIAWQRDDGSGSDNLDIRLRIVDRLEGGFLTDERGFESTRAGAAFLGNVLQPDVVSTETGWMLAGTGGIEGNFRVFLAELDADGLPVGDLIEPLPDATLTQQGPILDMDATGAIHLAFQAEGEITEAWYAVDGLPAERIGDGGFPGVAANGPFVGFSDPEGDVWFGPFDDPVALGPTGAGVAVAASGTGGFVGWYRHVSGLSNQLKVGRFDAEGAVGLRTDLGTESAAPYGWNLTPITDDVVFVAWQEGDSPGFRAFGRFVTP